MPAAFLTNGCVAQGLGGVDRPAESGELAGRCDRDDRSALAAGFHPRPEVMQASLGLPEIATVFGSAPAWRRRNGSLILGRWR